MVQKVDAAVDFQIEHFSGSGDCLEKLINDFIRPFDLKKAPLIRVGLCEINSARYLMMIDVHHIVADGASVMILVKEYINFYENQQLPELKLQYKDFAKWQNELFRTDYIKKQERYWLEVFQGEIPVLDMPLDFPRSTFQSYQGERVNFNVGNQFTEKINKFTSKTKITLFMLLLAAYYILLSKYTGQADIIIGTPILGRRYPDLENLIGILINTLAIRNYPAADKTGGEFLQEVKESAIKAYANQEYQFEMLSRKNPTQSGFKPQRFG